MGIRTAVADAIVRWAMQRSGQGPRYAGSWMGMAPIFPDWSTDKAIKEGYKASYIYYAVASDLADCQRAIPWRLKRMTKTGPETVDTHPLVSMLRRPNGEDTWGALTESWDLYKSLGGNGYGQFKPNGDTVNVWRLRNDRIRIKPDKRGYIDHYEYTISGHQPEAIPVEEMLHFKFFDPGSDHFGLAPLQAAAALVNTSNAGLKWNQIGMGNRARPDLWFNPKTPFKSNEQYEKFLKLLKKNLIGGENAHRFIFSPEPMEIEQMSLSPIEMDFIRSLEFYEVAVCKVLHVHPEAIGYLGSTFENKKWAIRAKWEGPVNSRAREMRAVLNMKFALLFGTAYPPGIGDLYLDYDLSDTPAVIEARNEALESAYKVWSMGVCFNRVDEQYDLGFGPQPGGDTGYIPVNLLPVSAGSSERGSSRSFNPTTDEHRQAEWRAIDRKKEGWERGVAVKVAELFAGERKKVVAAIKAGHFDVDYVIDGEREKWVKLLTAVKRAVIEDFGGKVADDLSGGATEVGPSPQKAFTGLSGDRFERRYEFDPWNVLIQDYVRASTAEAVTWIQTTTKKAIRKVVLEGMEAGESMVTIARKVEGEFIKWEGQMGTGYRSMMIARTEVHAAAGFGMHESARQSGVAQEKHWQDAGDDRVRPAHRDNTASGWIGFDEAYPNGAMYPGDGTDDVGCRCVEMYRSR